MTRMRAGLGSFAFLLLLGLTAPPPAFAAGSGPVALQGTIRSDQEGAMGGVLVSATKAGSTITTTVVTDEQGHYAFPASRLTPGKYDLVIRAVGYEIDGFPNAMVVAGKFRIVGRRNCLNAWKRSQRIEHTLMQRRHCIGGVSRELRIDAESGEVCRGKADIDAAEVLHCAHEQARADQQKYADADL